MFSEEFQSKSFGWNSQHFNTDKIEALDSIWNDEANLKTFKEFSFFYNFFGFKKAGTENFGEHLTLKFEMQH